MPIDRFHYVVATATRPEVAKHQRHMALPLASAAGPLAVAPRTIRHGIYSSDGHCLSSELDTTAPSTSIAGRSAGKVSWRPAGADANHRAVAAARFCRDQDLRCLPSAWA